MRSYRAGDRGQRHPRNRTKYAALDKLAADPRIERIWDEGPDGIWADLAPGYNMDGTSSLHGEIDDWGRGDPKTAVTAIIEQAKAIEKGDTY